MGWRTLDVEGSENSARRLDDQPREVFGGVVGGHSSRTYLSRLNQVCQQPLVKENIMTIAPIFGLPLEHLPHKSQELLFFFVIKSLL